MPLIGGAVDDAERLLDAPDEPLAIRRQTHTAPVALEQRDAQPVFDGADAAADRAMRDAARLGRRAERSATYFVPQRRLIPVYGALACTAYTLLAGALLLSPWLPGAVDALFVAPAGTLRAVLILGIFPAAIGYATWTFALGYFGAARAANFLYLTPAVAMTLSVAMTGERPGIVTLAGGLMASAGVIFVAWRGRR